MINSISDSVVKLNIDTTAEVNNTLFYQVSHGKNKTIYEVVTTAIIFGMY